MTTDLKLIERNVPVRARALLEQAGVDPLLARLYAARGVSSLQEIENRLEGLLLPESLHSAQKAAILLADAIASQQKLCIIADYDCDGATACAVAMRGLSLMGAQVDYLVPNRFETGYGLSPEVVTLAAAHPRLGKPDWLLTVDNGIASVEGVAAAKELGMRVLITDHHLPGLTLPAADCIVNPNQMGCNFGSKHLAGVGVMFYVLLALRSELRERGVFTQVTQPRLDTLLDLVALGTIADVVVLDANNRRLVAQGLKRIRQGRMQPGLAALFSVAGRDFRRATTFDLGFALGPRINAAGRLADMSVGIACLLANDADTAATLAQQLDAINHQRREIESDMQIDALASLTELSAEAALQKSTLVLHNPNWHQGVVGIVAGRIKEKFWLPTIVFAPASDTSKAELRGSGRSIPGLHLRDALDLVTKRSPALIKKFGGHAMAAGLTIDATNLEIFRQVFEEVCELLLDPSAKLRAVMTDGALQLNEVSIEQVLSIEEAIWGQGFNAPLFCNTFTVVTQRIVKDKHLKLSLRPSGNTSSNRAFDGIWFGHTQTLPEQVNLAYRLAINQYQGIESLQLVIEHAQEVAIV